MNARKEIRDALLVRRMEHWLMVARCPLIAKGFPAWKARKNYWALLKTHGALAAKHGYTPTAVL